MTTTTHSDQRPDVQEMVVVHRAFRRESGAAASYIRTTPEGDTRRAKVVADHLRLCMAGLEMHHTGEDVVLWPLLLERAAPSTGLVETMPRGRRVEQRTVTVTATRSPGRMTSTTMSSSPGRCL
jgi:Hemerythrin HHE cation binding domain